MKKRISGHHGYAPQLTRAQQNAARSMGRIEGTKNLNAQNERVERAKEKAYLLAPANEEILSMVDKVLDGDFKANDKVSLGKVSKEIAQKIQALTGIAVEGFDVVVEARQIEHILKDHGQNGHSDHSMANPVDIAKMGYVLKKPDDIRPAGETHAYTNMVDGKNRLAKTVLYEKDIDGKSYYVVQAVPNTKAKTLYIVSAFIGKEGYKKEALQLTDAKNPSATPKSGSARTSNNSIPKSSSKVNTQKEKPTKLAGRISFEGKAFELTKPQRIQVKALNVLAKALGVEIYLYKSEPDENGKYTEDSGWFDPKDSSIHIDINAGVNGRGTLLFTAAHELIHYIRQWSPTKFKVMADFLMQQYGRAGVSVEDLIQDQMDNDPKLDYDAAYEEVVASACEQMLADGDILVKLKLLAAEEAGLVGKIRERIEKLAKAIRSLYSGMQPESPEAKLVAEMYGTADRLQKLFYEALLDARQNSRGVGGKMEGTGEVKRQIRRKFYEEFDAWDKKNTNVSFVVGTTSNALQSIGMKNQEIVLRSGTVLQKVKKHSEMTFDIFKKIPELLEKPIIVQFSDAIDPKTGKPKYDSRITVLGELYADMQINGKTEQKPVLVSIELLPTNQKKTAVLDFSVITSAYAKNVLQQYINENSILYIEPNKKRTMHWLSLNRLQLPLGESQYGSIRRIAYSGEKVKIENSKNMTAFQKALQDAGAIDSYGNSILDPTQKDTTIKHQRRREENTAHSSKSLASRKKTRYNEFASEAMNWANRANRQSGDATVLYDGRRKKYVLVEALEDGYFEAALGTYAEVTGIYERLYEKEIRGLYDGLDQSRSKPRSGVWNLQLSQNGGYDAGDVGSVGSQGLQADAAGNDEHLRRGDQRESVTDSTIKRQRRRQMESEADEAELARMRQLDEELQTVRTLAKNKKHIVTTSYVATLAERIQRDAGASGIKGRLTEDMVSLFRWLPVVSFDKKQTEAVSHFRLFAFTVKSLL